jgi:DNA-binding transcriptional LysR family regulator
LEFRLIRHALALGRHRHFARAAESLGLTQPSLSRSIAALEEELGVRLFDRTRDGVRPTAFGELLLARGAALVQGEDEFRRELRLLAGLEGGTLCVGAGPYPAEISVGTAAGRLLREHPRLRLELVCADPEVVVRGVLARQLDVGLCDPRGLADVSRLSIEPLPEHPLVMAGRPGHPLAGRKALNRDEVLAYPLATTSLTGSQAAAAAGREIDPGTGAHATAVHVNTISLACRVARESDALLPATAGMIARDVAEGQLVALDFRDPEMCTKYSLVTRADRSPAPAVAAYCAILREVEREIAAAESGEPRSPAAAKTRRRGKSGVTSG